MNLKQALSAYLAELKPSPSLHHAIVMSWTRFSEFCEPQGLERLDQLAPSHVEAFHQQLLWQPGPSGKLYASNTVDYILRFIRNLTRWATERGHIALNPTRDLKLCKPLPPQSRVLTWKELQAILGAIDRSTAIGCRDAALFAMLAETKLRTKRCLDLDLRDQAALELEPKTAELLRAYVDGVRGQWVRNAGQRALFLTTFGARLGAQTVSVRLDELALLAGVEGNVTPRMLWRSYRAALSQSGSSRLAIPDP
jgi:site-specific recombinase XerD